MEAMPDMRTIDFWLNGDKSQAYPQSRVMANHNKADGYERRLALYMIENYSASRAIL
jgi:beta-mannosidase